MTVEVIAHGSEEIIVRGTELPIAIIGATAEIVARDSAIEIVPRNTALEIVVPQPQPVEVTVTNKSSPVPVLVLRGGGSGGTGDNGYEHLQPSPSTVWNVVHGLGRRPAVQVFSTGGLAVEADVLHVTLNNLQILFNEPFAGYARVI